MSYSQSNIESHININHETVVEEDGISIFSSNSSKSIEELILPSFAINRKESIAKAIKGFSSDK